MSTLASTSKQARHCISPLNSAMSRLSLFLLDAGAHIDDANESHDTACHVAVREDRIDVVKLLVAHNANLSLQNSVEGTPIVIALYRKNELLVMLLVDAAIAAGIALDDATLCLAATIGTDAIRSLVFKHRINLNAIRDMGGRTPLHQAIWGACDSSVLDMLIGVAGLDVDARDEMGCTAAYTACTMSDTGALARLVAAGANLELADNNGDTPLHCSLFDASDQIVVMLLAAGANANAKNNQGSTLCHMICTTSLVSLPALMAFGAKFGRAEQRRCHTATNCSRHCRQRPRKSHWPASVCTVLNAHWCANVHSRFAARSARSTSTHYVCARFYFIHVDQWRHSFRFTFGGNSQPK
jgi:ankyrin repeat protein